MKTIFDSKNFPSDIDGPCVALGNFDGVHIAHRKLVERAIEAAGQSHGTSVVYTFNPHPVMVLAPDECPPLIQTLDQKLKSLEEVGVDVCVVEPFTRDFAEHGAEDFFRKIILERLHAAEVIVGYDFTFGLKRHGTVSLLEKFGREHKIKISTLPAQFLNETLISSTNIRNLVEHGKVDEAAKLLGRNYMIEGRVVTGRGIGGRELVRTANLESINCLIPRDGIYITRTNTGGKTYPSITSLGVNPTFPNSSFAIETHLIDITLELVGKTIEVEFIKRLREQITFDSVGKLGEQILKDIDLARKYFNT